MKKYKLILTTRKLDFNAAISFVKSKSSGGIVVFCGTVRNHNNNKKVIKIKYSSYKEMALSEMKNIVEFAMKRWEIKKAYLSHAEGELKIGMTSVIVALSCEHRKEAFEACRYLIDTLKKKVPIWKQEFYENSKKWVS